MPQEITHSGERDASHNEPGGKCWSSHKCLWTVCWGNWMKRKFSSQVPSDSLDKRSRLRLLLPVPSHSALVDAHRRL